MLGPEFAETPRSGWCPCCIRSWVPGMKAVSFVDAPPVLICENCLRAAIKLIDEQPETPYEKMLQDAAKKGKK